MFERFIGLFNKCVVEPVRPLYPTIKVLEVLGVIAALIAFSYDFIVEKPRDRAVANAALLVEVANIDESSANYHPVMNSLVTLLLDDGVPLERLTLPPLEIAKGEFEDVEIRYSDLSNSRLSGVVFKGGRFLDVTLEQARFSGVSFDSVSLLGDVLASKPIYPKEDIDDSFAEFFRLTYRANYRHMKLYNPAFQKVSMDSVNFTGSVMYGPSFTETTVSNSVFDEVRFFPDVDLREGGGATKLDVLFDKSLFTRTDFSIFNLKEMNQIRFVDCIFKNVNFPAGYELPEGAGVVLE